MTELQLAEAERAAIVKRAGGLHKLKSKRRRFTPSAAASKALHEAGVSARDAAMLAEAVEHERAFLADEGPRLRVDLPPHVADAIDVLQEQVGSDAAGMLIPPTQYGWTERTARQATGYRMFVHGTHGTLHTSPGKWVRRALVGGLIAGSGTDQASLDAHVRGLKAAGDAGGNPAASGAADANAEALADVLAFARSRALGESPRPNLKAAQIMEAVRAREVGRAATPASGEDLHARLRAALVR